MSVVRLRSSVMLSILLIFILCSLVWAEETCLNCHKDKTKNKVIHPAIEMGCTTCHSALDASNVPHHITNSLDYGLKAGGRVLCFSCHDKASFTHRNIHPALNVGCTACHNPHSSNNQKLLLSPMPELCYNCHNKTSFTRAKVHPAIEAGCTACHNPHSTETEKLLLKDMPELCFKCHDSTKFHATVVHVPVQAGLCTACHNPHSARHDKLLEDQVPQICFNCHDKKIFSRKNIHPPVKEGQCLECHTPHASEEIKLLLSRPILVCLRCHGNVRRTPHAIVGFSSVGHPLGKITKSKNKKKMIMNPLRKDREFYCGSCHDPHSSDWMRLFRYETSSPLGLCVYCHKNFF